MQTDRQWPDLKFFGKSRVHPITYALERAPERVLPLPKKIGIIVVGNGAICVVENLILDMSFSKLLQKIV